MKMRKTAAALLATVMAASVPLAGAVNNALSVTANAEETGVKTEGDWEYKVNEDGETVTLSKYNGTDTTVVIPTTLGGKNVSEIAARTFEDCTSLESAVIPESVETLDGWAFKGCSSLKSITIPNSVTSMPFNIGVGGFWPSYFSECTSLTEINVASDNEFYSSVNGVLCNKDQTELICYPLGKQGASYKIPDSVTSINNAAFLKCTLTSVIIPESVTKIGVSAFGGCTSLASVTIPDSVTSIGDDAFFGCSSLSTVNYCGTKEEWEAIENNDSNLANAEIVYNFEIPESPDTNDSETSEPTSNDTSTVTPGDTDPVSEPDSSTDKPTVLEATLKNVDSENGLSGEQLDKQLFGDSGWTWAQVEKIVFTSDSLFSVQYTAVDGSTKTLGEKTSQRAEDEGIWNTEWTLDTSLMSKDKSFVKLIAKDGSADIKAAIYIKKDASKPSTDGDQANTGIALAIAPIALAASAVVVASKKKK